MSGIGQKYSCNNDALLLEAEEAIRKSASLRLQVTDARLMNVWVRGTRVLPSFHTSRQVSLTPEATHLVAIVFSAGGLSPLIRLLHDLPADFPAAVAVAHHAGETSCLPELLRNQTALAVKFAETGDALHDATVYVCPPSRHLIVNPDATIGLSSTPRVRFARPSANWFLRSAAGAFDKRALAVVLSGASSDGAEGVARISDSGGKIFVQDPRTCRFTVMPQAAVDTGCACQVSAPEQMAAALIASLEQHDRANDRVEWEQPFGPIAA